MDSKVCSELTRIVTALAVFFVNPVYSVYCIQYSSYSGRTTYVYCRTSCCGDECCSESFSTVYIVLIVIGCALLLGVFLACWCCRRRRAIQGTVVANQPGVQHTVMFQNGQTTGPVGIQMHTLQGVPPGPMAVNHQQQPMSPMGQPNINFTPPGHMAFNHQQQPRSPMGQQNFNFTPRQEHMGPSQLPGMNYITPMGLDPPSYDEISGANQLQPPTYYDLSGNDQSHVNSGYETPVDRENSGYETPVGHDDHVYDQI